MNATRQPAPPDPDQRHPSDDNEPAQCPNCSGSGEGFSEGTTCRACKGMGEINHHKETA